MISVWLPVQDDEENVSVWSKQIVAWLLGRRCKYEFDPWRCGTKTDADGFLVEVKVEDEETAGDLKTDWLVIRYLALDRP